MVELKRKKKLNENKINIWGEIKSGGYLMKHTGLHCTDRERKSRTRVVGVIQSENEIL